MDHASIWGISLAAFREDLAGIDPAPAAVTASCVTAELGLGLLLKVLHITARRKSFQGDLPRLNALIEAAREESRQLRLAADADIEAVHGFIGSRDPQAVRNAIEIPMRAARAVARGADLCAGAAGLIQGLPAADLGAAAIFLSAALRAILISVDFNLRLLDAQDAYAASIRAERRSLEDHVLRIASGW